jgi:uncharacterized surface protein with fasciclin (FAS1) repeats
MKHFKSLLVALVAMTLAAPAMAGGHKAHEKALDIVDTAASAEQFTTLIAAAKAAGLAGALKGDGPLTVFAPTDDAFGALPAGTIETLLRPENKEQLATILKYHVIAGEIGSGALADGARIETLAGLDVEISQTEKGFNIQNARIVATDIDASNGVIHVIDRVILPPAKMSRTDAAQAIQNAVDRGVPMFNHGNMAGTVAVYKAVAEQLIREGGLSAEERIRLQTGIDQAADAHDMRASAWQLRYALDDVSASLHSDGQMRTNRDMTP